MFSVVVVVFFVCPLARILHRSLFQSIVPFHFVHAAALNRKDDKSLRKKQDENKAQIRVITSSSTNTSNSQLRDRERYLQGNVAEIPRRSERHNDIQHAQSANDIVVSSQFAREMPSPRLECTHLRLPRPISMTMHQLKPTMRSKMDPIRCFCLQVGSIGNGELIGSRNAVFDRRG